MGLVIMQWKTNFEKELQVKDSMIILLRNKKQNKNKT